MYLFLSRGFRRKAHNIYKKISPYIKDGRMSKLFLSTERLPLILSREEEKVPVEGQFDVKKGIVPASSKREWVSNDSVRLNHFREGGGGKEKKFRLSKRAPTFSRGKGGGNRGRIPLARRKGGNGPRVWFAAYASGEERIPSLFAKTRKALRRHHIFLSLRLLEQLSPGVRKGSQCTLRGEKRIARRER